MEWGTIKEEISRMQRAISQKLFQPDLFLSPGFEIGLQTIFSQIFTFFLKITWCTGNDWNDNDTQTW